MCQRSTHHGTRYPLSIGFWYSFPAPLVSLAVEEWTSRPRKRPGRVALGWLFWAGSRGWPARAACACLVCWACCALWGR